MATKKCTNRTKAKTCLKIFEWLIALCFPVKIIASCQTDLSIQVGTKTLLKGGRLEHRRSQDFRLKGDPNHKLHAMIIRNFRKRNFSWGKEIVGLIWHLTRISLTGEGNPKLDTKHI